MSKELPVFNNKLKSIQQLGSQLDQAVGYSQFNFGESIVQPNMLTQQGKDELLHSGYGELNTRFPQRMEIYRHIINAQRRGEDLTEEQKQHFSRWLHVLNSLDQYIETHKQSTEEDRTLYDRQFTVFEDLRDYLEEGNTEGYIKLPTGTGKTVLFTEFVEATGLKTLIVTPTRLLVDQTQERFQQFAPDLETGKYYSEEKDYSKNVTITTYNSLINLIDEGKINPAEYDLLILDEVHKSLSDRRKEAVNQFINAFKIGFTATPRYAQDKHVRDLLNTEIHNMGIREAVEEGMLSSLSVYLAQTETDLSNVRITEAGEYLDRDLDRAVNIESRNRSAVELYQQMFNGQKAVAYCVSIQHATDLANNFNSKGIPAAVVYGNQYRPEQRDILKRYRKGEIQVVCNADLLIEGFDEPSVNVCLNLRPTASPVVAEQRAGRVLREDSNNPFKHAYIVDFIDRYRNPNFFPVSFAQIVESAHVYQLHASTGGGDTRTGLGTPHYPQIDIQGLKVTIDAEEVTRIVREMVDQKYPILEEGWSTLNALWRRFRIAGSTIRKLIEPYRETHPQYFKTAKNPVNNHVNEYIAPELIDIIANTRANIQAPIEGWVNTTNLANTLNTVWDTVRKEIGLFRQSHAEHIRVFRISCGRLIEHVSPELAALITEKFKSISPPEEWIYIRRAAVLLRMSPQLLYEYVKKDEYSNDSGKFKRPQGPMAIYISPSLLQRINEEREKIPQAPEDWTTNKVLSEQLGVGDRTLKGLVKKYLESNPDYLKFFKTKQEKIAQFYSPELVFLITEECNSMPETAPEGWITGNVFATQLRVSYRGLKRITEKYRDTYPKYLRLFKTSQSKIVEFYSPELVDLITQEYHFTQMAEPNWKTKKDIEKELHVDHPKIVAFVDQFRTSNPEYFKLARDAHGKKFFEYLSPELVDIIRKLKWTPFSRQ